jgi:Domain of unknown function (DUF4226)
MWTLPSSQAHEDRHIVGGVTFWQQQIDELLMGIKALVGADAPPYTESAAGSGVGVPDNRPPTPFSAFPMSTSAAREASTIPASGSGKGSDAAADAESSVRQRQAVIDKAEHALHSTLNDSHTAAAAARARLQRIHQEITAGVAAMQPSISTPAGRQQMADFLQAEAQQACQVVTDSQRTAAQAVSALNSIGHQYASTL